MMTKKSKKNKKSKMFQKSIKADLVIFDRESRFRRHYLFW